MVKDVVHKVQNKGYWRDNSATILLILILLVFSGYSVFLAFNLQSGIIPDEPAHFTFSKYFSTTPLIPPDTLETSSLGWYIQQNPFLYHYINGRIINIVELVTPSASDRALLVALRLVNVAYAVGSIIFCFLLSKEIINHKWWQLLPPFLLSNTLMFVFLAGGVNYDNLANLLSIAGIYLLIRVFKGKNFFGYSLGWMIVLGLGTLVKYTLLPLALVMFITWLIFSILRKKKIIPAKKMNKKLIALMLLFFVVLIANFALYGYNLVAYQSITPACNEILSNAQCDLSPYTIRYGNLALDQKLTLREVFSSDYPDPVNYLLDDWIPILSSQIFGIAGHRTYTPNRIAIIYRGLFLAILLLAYKYWKNPDFSIYSLVGIVLFYIAVLFVVNYNSELVYGFKHIAVQGRYLFPVIGIVYTLAAYFIKKVPQWWIKYPLLALLVVLFIYGGPINFILKYNTHFSGWF